MYIKLGAPQENGHIESFHDKLRDECLDRELFGSLREARVILERYRKEYNEERPHSALGYRTPEAYVREIRNKSDGGCAPPNPAPLAAAGVQVEQTPSLPPPKTALQPFPVTQPKTNLLAITIQLRVCRLRNGPHILQN
jgi:hypothetical protein